MEKREFTQILGTLSSFAVIENGCLDVQAAKGRGLELPSEAGKTINSDPDQPYSYGRAVSEPPSKPRMVSAMI
jgi:hypothetical protein